MMSPPLPSLMSQGAKFITNSIISTDNLYKGVKFMKNYFIHIFSYMDKESLGVIEMKIFIILLPDI